MRGAMLCLPADLTTHAVYNFSPCRVLKMGGNARVAQERREGREGRWRGGVQRREVREREGFHRGAGAPSVKVSFVPQKRREGREG